ncbi:centrosomal protein of 164 kDa [Drosophila novamexicana]|uniref:centrosomal protein of 164 kDa n=1 Tax=Drosophila novamexicana TaxID=47314 RepID=UPI0011E5DA8F|nr:centrosomal protein of 164 kDa [Drosophila novamexicana]
MANNSNSSATASLATTPATTPTALTTAATTAKRLGYTAPASTAATASVICEEVFDEACLPSSEEINDYASLIGIEPSKEPHLLYLAKEGLMAALPPEWKICYSEEKSGHYYYNTRTKQSQWDHPLDAVYRELVEQTRQKMLLLGTGAAAGAATPIIDNSDDMSQLDSGIRSMQGTDELLDDMSSPLNNGASQQPGAAAGAGSSKTHASASAAFPGPSGFSGGVSRFLETRGKSFGPIFQPVKNTRFEVAKTNTQISLAMKFAPAAAESQPKSGFQLSGNGAMFLKSRRQLEPTEPASGNAYGVKGILRDTSLTDMRRRYERDEDAATMATTTTTATEDKKSVRFNLVETQRICSSPVVEEENARKPSQSPELSDEEAAGLEEHEQQPVDGEEEEEEEEDEEEEDVAAEHADEEEEEEEDEDDDDDVWDEDVADPDAMVGMCSLNPFISDSPKGIRIISLPKSQTIQMLKAQEESAGVKAETSSYLDKLKECAGGATVKPLYEDTDSDSKGSSVRSFIVNKSEQDNPFELEQLQRKSLATSEKLGMRSLKMASKLVGLLKSKEQQQQQQHGSGELLGEEDMEAIKREHEARLKSLRHEYDLRLSAHQQQLEEAFQLQLEEYRGQLEQQLQSKRAQVVHEHKQRMATLQSNHAELLHELERDLRSEQELLRREHAAKLGQMRDKLSHELELEKQRLRDNGEERLYEKVRCEKRLLEDKYRCLKEKYVRLKTDVKLSLERRSRRREAQALQQQLEQGQGQGHTQTTTNSETERSLSQKPSIGNSENRSLSYSEQAGAGAMGGSGGVKLKPPVPPKTHLSKPSGIASKYIKQLQLQEDTNTSLSQSDTTISNNYGKGRYLAPAANTASTVLLSDNGNSDSEAQHETNNNNNNNNNKLAAPRKKLFSRTKSASTSRLNSENFKQLEQRPCTPVENLRHQLQKLEDLEDQLPEHTLDTTYHLRYPFTDHIAGEHAQLVGTVVGSELEFFKHRIHLERDSVRRAKESLRTQRTNFRARQREIKQRHKSLALAATRHSLDQLIQEEKELTEMEVNLHRTRALLGEKVIRLRHLEQSLLRIYEKEKQPSVEPEPKDEAATLSDLSSHSSSGFSSTDFASGAAAADLHKRKEYFQQESNECIQNLEILNAEIREILDILGHKQQQQQHLAMAMPLISPNELSWSHMLSQQSGSGTATATATASAGSNPSVHAPQSIPTLADRLETYRQLAAGRMHSSMGGAILAANTIVSQSPRAVNYTTSLVERTRDLRNWLRQAKTEHELLTGIGVQHGLTLPPSVPGASAAAGGVPGGGGAAGSTQTNL